MIVAPEARVRRQFVHKWRRPVDEVLRVYADATFRQSTDESIRRAIPVVSDLFRRLRDEAKRRGIWESAKTDQPPTGNRSGIGSDSF